MVELCHARTLLRPKLKLKVRWDSILRNLHCIIRLRVRAQIQSSGPMSWLPENLLYLMQQVMIHILTFNHSLQDKDRIWPEEGRVLKQGDSFPLMGEVICLL